MQCHTLLYIVTPLYTTSYIMPHPPIQYHTLLYPMSHPSIQCHTPLYTPIQCHTLLYIATPSYILPHPLIQCHTLLYIATPLYLQTLVINNEDLSFVATIGEGHFGIVDKMECKGTAMAVKVHTSCITLYRNRKKFAGKSLWISSFTFKN